MTCEATYPRRGLYRSRRSLLFGVCAGVAEYFDVSTFWTRVVVLVAFILTGFWPVGVLYLLAALLLKKDPFGGGRRHYECCRPAPRSAGGGNLDDRIRRMRGAGG